MAGSEKDVSELCMSCGLCCDGTLFPYGFIRDRADQRVAEDLGLPVTEFKDKLFFNLPCRCFSGCCVAYDKPRPYTCSTFFCPPLKRYHRGEQSFEDTESEVRLFREHRDKMLKIASQFPELADLHFRALKNFLEDSGEDPAFVAKYRQLYLMLFIFRDLHARYFTPAEKDKLAV